ncbi:hypothetical protein C8R44DRAFT_349611 [Mycena epipterygia]|nr:hypothetical protein C8R44DRAFT_349611 [Mycena epipterygia]
MASKVAGEGARKGEGMARTAVDRAGCGTLGRRGWTCATSSVEHARRVGGRRTRRRWNALMEASLALVSVCVPRLHLRTDHLPLLQRAVPVHPLPRLSPAPPSSAPAPPSAAPAALVLHREIGNACAEIQDSQERARPDRQARGRESGNRGCVAEEDTDILLLGGAQSCSSGYRWWVSGVFPPLLPPPSRSSPASSSSNLSALALHTEIDGDGTRQGRIRPVYGSRQDGIYRHGVVDLRPRMRWRADEDGLVAGGGQSSSGGYRA